MKRVFQAKRDGVEVFITALTVRRKEVSKGDVVILDTEERELLPANEIESRRKRRRG